MAVDFESFLSWAEDRFDHVVAKGSEVKLNSIFTDDYKNKMWCSPHGGKYHREDGVYHCWKTDKRGTLVGLVMEVDGCTYGEAKDILSGKLPLCVLEKKLDEYFAKQEEKTEKQEITLRLPDHCYSIHSLSNINKMEVQYYLDQRKLPADGLMYCTYGTYANRVVIPYYGRDGKLIYFNSRHIGKSTLKYLGPPKEVGVGKGDVLYARKWPKKGSKIYLTEGEFDALSLTVCGLNGIACGGKFISDKQIELIKDYDICLAFDGDSAGLMGMISIGNKLMAKQIRKITYARPPQGIKDWNKMLVTLKPEILVEWINQQEKNYDEWTQDVLGYSKL